MSSKVLDKNRVATVGDVENIVNRVVKRVVTKSVESLAISVANGFVDMATRMVTKEEFNEFKTEMYEFKEETGITLSRIDSKLEDHDLKLKEIDKKLDPLIIAYPIIQKEIRVLSDRVDKLEND